MRFLVDENLGRRLVDALRDRGHDVAWVVERMQGRSDVDILVLANAEERILITNDPDFGALVFHDRIACRGVVLLRIHDASFETARGMTLAAIEQYSDQLIGRFSVITDQSIRIRPLPDIGTTS